MVERLNIQIASEPMQLLADRALYWPARQRLIIADLHLGKGDTFRAAGISVPSGGTQHDLSRLTHLLRMTEATSLWILGDFLHARAFPQVDAAWRRFRAEHPDVTVTVVPGNHDRLLVAEDWGLQAQPALLHDAPFAFQHAPGTTANPGHVICGHLHPVVRLRGLGRSSVFWLARDQCVLPAFSAFTGGFLLPPTDAVDCVACDGQSLVPLGIGAARG